MVNSITCSATACTHVCTRGIGIEVGHCIERNRDGALSECFSESDTIGLNFLKAGLFKGKFRHVIERDVSLFEYVAFSSCCCVGPLRLTVSTESGIGRESGLD
jgi:hypothetical protein